MSDLRPALTDALAAFALPATVTVPGAEPVTTMAIWLPPVAVESGGVLVSTDKPLAILALPRVDIPEVPRGTAIEAAETEDGEILSWVVEAVLATLPDELRVAVIPAAETWVERETA